MSGPIKIAILAEAAKARAELKSVADSASKMGDRLKTGVAVGAAAAGVALAAFATSSIAGARESAQIHKVLESQMAGMGAAAKTAFSGATGFAADFGEQIGRDDDDILSVVNKLSTFPAAFGKGSLGAQAMERATRAAFDLEAAGIGSAEGNIVGLGKAMDNPIKGLTALAKSGVSFTEEQKKQITNYMKQGDLAGAQKVLLDGVETNAKGAAAAQADGIQKAQTALAGWGEEIASALLPKLNEFGDWFTKTGLPAIKGFASASGPAFAAIGSAIGSVVTAMSNPFVQVFAAAILGIAVAIGIASAATSAWTVVMGIFNAVAALNPISLIVLAVVGLIAALVAAYFKFDGFRQLVDTVWSAITTVIGTAVSFIKDNLASIGLAILGPIGWIILLWQKCETFRTIVTAVWTAVTTTISTAVTSIIAWGVRMWAGIQAAWARIPGFVSGLVSKVVAFFSGIPGKVSGAIAKLGTMFGTAVGKAVTFVAGLPGKVKGIFAGAATWLWSAGSKVIGGFVEGLKSMWGTVQGWLSKLTNAIPDWKGPASRDKKLLYGNGQLVIGGFVKGLRSQYGTAEASLRSFTGSLVAASAPALDAVSSLSSANVKITPVSRVTSGDPSTADASQQEFTVNLVLDGRQLGAVMIDPIRREVRARGGLTATFAR